MFILINNKDLQHCNKVIKKVWPPYYCDIVCGYKQLKGDPALGGRELIGFDREEFNEYFLNSEDLLLVLSTTSGTFFKSFE